MMKNPFDSRKSTEKKPDWNIEQKYLKVIGAFSLIVSSYILLCDMYGW